MRETAENSGALPTPPLGAVPVPDAPPPPVPPGPPVPMRASELEHPSIVARLAAEEPEPDEALVALAALPADALAPPTFLDPIGLPEATRLSVLAIFQDRAAIWDRLDQLAPHSMEFERAVQRAFGPGEAPELEPLTAGGDPEAEVAALRDAVTADLEQVRDLNAAISADKIELQRLNNTASHGWLWVLILAVLVAGGVAAVGFLL